MIDEWNTKVEGKRTETKNKKWRERERRKMHMIFQCLFGWIFVVVEIASVARVYIFSMNRLQPNIHTKYDYIFGKMIVCTFFPILFSWFADEAIFVSSNSVSQKDSKILGHINNEAISYDNRMSCAHILCRVCTFIHIQTKKEGYYMHICAFIS